MTGCANFCQYSPCSAYVSSLTMPDSTTAKSALVDVGNVCATYSSKSPTKPGSDQPGQLAFARVTELWNRRTLARSPVSSSTLTSMPAVLPASAPPTTTTLTSAHWPRASVPT